MYQNFSSPIDKQVFLNPEAVGASVTPAAVAIGPSGGAGLPGIGRRILLITVQIRQLSAFTPQAGVLASLLADSGSVDNEGVLMGGGNQHITPSVKRAYKPVFFF